MCFEMKLTALNLSRILYTYFISAAIRSKWVSVKIGLVPPKFCYFPYGTNLNNNCSFYLIHFSVWIIFNFIEEEEFVTMYRLMRVVAFVPHDFLDHLPDYCHP
jgi:hypothetical protein